MGSIRVLVADDEPVVRSGLRFHLACEPDMEFVGEVTRAGDLTSRVADLRPDVLVVDPRLSGLEIADLAGLRRDYPSTWQVVFTSAGSRNHVGAFLRAGATGYLLKTASLDDVVTVIRVVMRGEVGLDSTVAVGLARTGTTVSALTAREVEVVALLAQGKSSRQIGRELCISARTVDTHRTNIMRKLNIHSVAGLVLFCVRTGLVEEP